MTNKPTTILLVDDKDWTRYTVSRLLRSERYVVREAPTGADALRLAAQKPDLIILDIKLPDLDGYEVCRRIKADPATASIPVLHLSATFVESDSRSTGLEGRCRRLSNLPRGITRAGGACGSAAANAQS